MKAFFAVFILTVFQQLSYGQNKIENVVLITLDGARNQEVFGGLDLEILQSVEKKPTETEVYKRYFAETPGQRRRKLMPFFWNELMTKYGSIAGNRQHNSTVQTTNQMFFSYPGYSEILTGEAHDDVISSNGFGQNPYPSFLDFLQKKMKLGFNEVVSFASWDVMNRIATNKPDSFLINAGYEEYRSPNNMINSLSEKQFLTLSPWSSVRHDFYTFNLALEHIKEFRPRVIHLGLGETDDWAHDKNYERVLDSLNLSDTYIREFWDFLQSDSQYRDKTAIIIVVDHGRGNSPEDWYSHGQSIAEAQFIWMAFISPNLKIRGEWRNSLTIYQNQIAATLCKFLDFDYSEQNPRAGKPISAIFNK